MSEITVLRDAEGNYYTFGTAELAAAKVEDGSYQMAAAAVDAARVPDDGREAVEAALGIDEVSGFAFGEPIPELDVKLGKNPGGSAMFANLGSVAMKMRPPSGFAAGGAAGLR